jgi:hypothetical protein
LKILSNHMKVLVKSSNVEVKNLNHSFGAVIGFQNENQIYILKFIQRFSKMNNFIEHLAEKLVKKKMN